MMRTAFQMMAVFSEATSDEALIKASKAPGKWLESNKNLLNSLVSGEIRVSDNEEFIRVLGWPPVKNPFYHAA